MGDPAALLPGTSVALSAGILLAAAAVLLVVPRAPRRISADGRTPGVGHRAVTRPGSRAAPGAVAGDAAAEADAAMLLDLAAALLTAGVGIEAALDRLARTIPGAEPLEAVHRSLNAGAGWEQAWAGQSGQLAELGAQLSFAHATGAPTADLLQVGARQLRRRRRHEAERRAEELGVKMVLPLGACFLPAFILLGVLPVVLGLLPQVLNL